MKLHTKTLVLVGMMGAGKTTIGQLLAAILKVPFFDNDEEIEQIAGKSISAIFDEEGESAFRAMETERLRALLLRDPCVIATGGGAFLNQGVRKLIREKALSIWLDGPSDIIFERACKSGRRPLLQSEDARAVFDVLYQERKEIYALADIHVENDNYSSQKTVNEILNAIEKVI